MTMKNFVSDELANKVYHLTKALDKAEYVLETLQKENERLKRLLQDMVKNEHLGV